MTVNVPIGNNMSRWHVCQYFFPARDFISPQGEPPWGRTSASRGHFAVLSSSCGRWSRHGREVLLGKQDLSLMNVHERELEFKLQWRKVFMQQATFASGTLFGEGLGHECPRDHHQFTLPPALVTLLSQFDGPVLFVVRPSGGNSACQTMNIQPIFRLKPGLQANLEQSNLMFH